MNRRKCQYIAMYKTTRYLSSSLSFCCFPDKSYQVLLVLLLRYLFSEVEKGRGTRGPFFLRIPTNVAQVIAIWISLPFPFSHPQTKNVSVILSCLYDIIHVYLLSGKYSSDDILTYLLGFKSNFTSSVKIFLTSGQFVLCAPTDVLMTLLISLFCLFIC